MHRIDHATAEADANGVGKDGFTEGYAPSGGSAGVQQINSGASSNTWPTDSAGSGYPHNNMQPTAFLNAMIKL